MPAQQGPELQPTGPRVSATCSSPSLPPRPTPPSPRLPTQFGPQALGALGLPPGDTHLGAASGSRCCRGPQPLAPDSALRRPRPPYSGFGGGASGEWPIGRGCPGACLGGGASGPHSLPGCSRELCGCQSNWGTADAQRLSCFRRPRVAACHPRCLRGRPQLPPPSPVTLGKSLMSFYFYLVIYFYFLI